MIAYVEDQQTNCRSVRIGRAISTIRTKTLRRCDNCQRSCRQTNRLDKKFQNLHDQIKLLQNKLRAADLDHALHSLRYKHGTLGRPFSWLLKLIETDKEGFIHWRG